MGVIIMEQKTNSLPYAMISAVLYVILAVLQLPSVFTGILYIRSLPGMVAYVWTLLYLAAYIVVAVMLFTKRRDIIFTISISVFALLSLRGFNIASIGYICTALIAFACLTDYLPQLKDISKKFWFVPVICLGINVIITFFMLLVNLGFRYALQGLLNGALQIGAVTTAILWIVFPNGMPTIQVDSFAGQNQSSGNTYNAGTSNIYCNIAKHVLLLLFTFGIWQLIWIYRTTEYLNIVEDEEPRNPTTKLLLCMFVPFYIIYWTYKSALRIDKLANAKGLSSDLATLCLILEIFISIVPPILMQDKINAIVTAETSGNSGAQTPKAPQTPPSPTQTPSVPNVDIAEEIKKYKDLLDSGALTQEEFDAKKKQLLNL